MSWSINVDDKSHASTSCQIDGRTQKKLSVENNMDPRLFLPDWSDLNLCEEILKSISSNASIC